MKKRISFYFGDSQDAIFPREYAQVLQGYELLAHEPYAKLKQKMGLKKLFFLRQVHSVAGVALADTPVPAYRQTTEQSGDAAALRDFLVHSIQEFSAFSATGDYLITNVPQVGIGIMTADCLPLLLHDPVTQSVAAIHAGWRGAVAGIVTRAIANMACVYGAHPKNIQAYIGPCIHACCYQVGEQVVQALNTYYASTKHSCYSNFFEQPQSLLAHVLYERGGNVYFDLPAFVAQQLCAAGLKQEAIIHEHTCCTYCTAGYWSYRLQGDQAGRHMSIISLCEYCENKVDSASL